MTPSPDLIAAVLALPMEARLLLAKQEGPGWWVTTWVLDTPPTPLQEAPRMCPDGPCDIRIVNGWAWLPASEVAWMEAATPEGGDWHVESDSFWVIRDHRELRAWSAPTAPACALAALRARFPA